MDVAQSELTRFTRRSACTIFQQRHAEAVGLGGDIGSLKPGWQGDVVIWSGDPLELDSAALSVWISGVKQPCKRARRCC